MRWAEFRSVVAITLALLLPVAVYLTLESRIDHTARKAYMQSCHGNNVVRQQFLDFVDSTVARSKKSLIATLASPSATPLQKRTASQNLVALQEVSADAHSKTKPQDCTYPPK